MILTKIKIENLNENLLENINFSNLHLKNSLNFDQLIAVTNLYGNYLVVAGAGTGKTRVIIYRTLVLLKLGISDKNILILTFTNKAVLELKDRIKEHSPNTNVVIETFHSFAYKFLKKFSVNKNFSIINRDETLKIFKHIKFISIEDLLSLLYLFTYNTLEFKNRFKTFNKKEKETILLAFSNFEKIKKEKNLLSFHDLIFNFIELLKIKNIPLPFSHIMVDEFQDTDSFQIELLKLLKCENIFAVGDDFQSIYSFRGALIDNFFNFPYFFKNTRTILLKENFRSTPSLINFTNHISKTLKFSFKKELISNLKDFEKPDIHIFKTFQDEYNGILLKIENILKKEDSSSIAILFRNNFLVTLYKEYFKHFKNIDILTIHNAKGLEWDFVFLPTLLDGILPSLFSTVSNLEEEKRLFYVACSRAKKGLFLSYPLYFYCQFGFFQKPSTFLDSLDETLFNVKRG